MFKEYVSLTKPGIIMGNLISVLAGYFLAAKSESITLSLLIYTMLGVALVIASGCVVNNIFDRDIDAKMSRTRNRAIVTGSINIEFAFLFAIIMLLIGTGLLYKMANPLSAVMVLLGYVFYVFFYTMWYKRTSVYGTLVGSVSGAIPPLVGYLAVTNYLSLEAVLLFGLFCLWQMPHSYAIAMFRMKDYQQANIPVLPLVKGIQKARQHIMIYVLVFSVVALGLYAFGHTGHEYLAVVAISCYGWFKVTYRNMDESNYVQWSKSVFKTSLLVITAFSTVLGIELLPFSITF